MDVPISSDNMIIIGVLVYVIRVLVDVGVRLVNHILYKDKKDPWIKVIESINELTRSIVKLTNDTAVNDRISNERRKHFDENLQRLFSRIHDDNVTTIEKVIENKISITDSQTSLHNRFDKAEGLLMRINDKVNIRSGK